MARPKKEQNLHRGYRVYIRFNELEYKLYKNLVETRVIYKDIEEEILLEIKKRDGL